MRISRIAATITISLKIDEIMECSWLTALWPCWVALCLLMVVSVGVLLLLIGTIYWWIGKKCSWDEVLCTIWLSWGVVGWSGSFGIALLLAALANDSKLSTYWLKTSISFPLIFLLSFVLWTHYLKARLIIWWSLFFAREDQIPESQVLPASQPHHSRPVSQQFTTLITSAPKILVRVSSTFFKPAPSPRFSRPQSVIDTRIFTHSKADDEKIISVSTLEADNSGDTVKAKACLVCYEAASNAVIMPCGHGGVCAGCAVLVWRDTGLCHLCRKRIESVVEVQAREKGTVKVMKTTYQLSPFTH